MLYARLNDAGTAFEPQRNLMTKTWALDGGGSVAADGAGNVYIVWHGKGPGGAKGEGGRAVWFAKSTDDGKTFAPERRANPDDTGACGCCGLRAMADRDGGLWVLYRSATEVLHRDMYLIASSDRGATFRSRKIDEWRVPKCVMSFASLMPNRDDMLLTWETEERVYFASAASSARAAPAISSSVAAPGKTRKQKHPVIARDSKGRTILAWTEGTGWSRGGAVAWQVYDSAGKPVAEHSGRRDGVPVWSLVAVFARPAGGFTIVY